MLFAIEAGDLLDSVKKQTKSDRIAGQEENMSDYRRLISYMYEYEGKEKGKNVGFVKLETKNGQCRLNLSIKKVYTGGNAAGVYLLGKRVKETFLGNIFIRGGNGDFHAIIDSNNVEGGGNDLKDYYGLTVHDVKNSWRSYTTIWEDAAFPETENDLAGQTQAYEILPGGRKPDPLKAASRAVMELDRELEQECTLRAAAQSIAPEPPQSEATMPSGTETARESEPAAVTEQPPQAAPPSGPKQPPLSEVPPPGTETVSEPEPAAVTGQPPQAASPSGPKQPSQPETTQPPGPNQSPLSEAAPPPTTEQPSQAASPSGPKQPPQSEATQPLGTEIVPEREPAAATEQPSQAASPSGPNQPPQAEAVSPSGPNQLPQSEAAPPTIEQPSQTTQPYPSPELEDPEVLRYLQDTEDIAANPEKLWQELRSSYPKIQPFEYENGCEILTIRPQDIGRLPRESWVYGNNSFLLHGYYNFRYIILFRLGDKNGRFRYMIGVPGHYYSSEKYMASMFGFPNFVLSKKQPPNDGRFGYWYTDIKLR